MSFKLTRREMIEQLGGGLGVVGLAGLFASVSRSELHAAGLGGNYAGPALPGKAKHVIMLYMNGGPSQIDMFDRSRRCSSTWVSGRARSTFAPNVRPLG